MNETSLMIGLQRTTVCSFVFTPPLIGEQSIVMTCLSVCLCVCLSVCSHIFGTTRLIFTIFFVHVNYGRRSVLWRRSDTLCTSGFMDNVIFAYKPWLLDVAAQLKRSAHVALGLAINCAQ